MTLDIDHLTSWIGRSEQAEERLHPFPSNALAATLDRGDEPYRDGSALPPLWHWLHFLPVTPLADVGEDGHPRRGGFLPSVPLPRRMWAGSRLKFLAPLCIGEVARRQSTVTSIEHKAGRSGNLVFVTVRHEVSSEAGLAIEEEHDIVYRSAPAQGAPAPTMIPAPRSPDFERELKPDPVLLFRYSALTFNSHRIHYDEPYVTQIEGYPGLVVHGPLIATLLLDALRREKPAATVRAFDFRAIAPVFAGDRLGLCGRMGEGGKVSLWARRGATGLAMEAQAELV